MQRNKLSERVLSAFTTQITPVPQFVFHYTRRCFATSRSCGGWAILSRSKSSKASITWLATCHSQAGHQFSLSLSLLVQPVSWSVGVDCLFVHVLIAFRLAYRRPGSNAANALLPWVERLASRHLARGPNLTACQPCGSPSADERRAAQHCNTDDTTGYLAALAAGGACFVGGPLHCRPGGQCSVSRVPRQLQRHDCEPPRLRGSAANVHSTATALEVARH